MPQLRQAADAGDPVAACQLAVELAWCAQRKRLELGAAIGDGMSPDSPISSLAPQARDCRGATEADIEDAYRYQAQAFQAGRPQQDRWFVQQPMLSDDDFRTNTPNAEDFRRRAPAYVARALQRKDVEDLKVLLEVYLPPGYFQSSSPLRIRDDAMFLALADAAQQAGIAEEYIRATAARVRQAGGPDLLTRSRARAAQVSGPWRSSASAADGGQARNALGIEAPDCNAIRG